MDDLATHRFASIFPLLEGEDFDRLVDDIAEHGQLEPIVLFERQILDGRNRYRACQELDIEPVSREFDGDDPVAYVVSLNLHRRHLNESQRAMVAAKLANLSAGDNQHSGRANFPDLITVTESKPAAVPVAKAAEMLNVSDRSVKAARTVQREAVPEIRKAVESGSVSV